MKRFLPVYLFLASGVALSAPRSSTNYTLTPEGFAPGGRSASASYTLDGALDPSGGPVASSANFTLKTGYVGQLYDLVGLNITAASPSVSEGAANQMGASALLDDDSTLALDSSDLAWSVVAGPLSGVSASGLAQTIPTFDDLLATVRGDLGTLTGTGAFTVLNVNPDDTSPVGGDGIDDAWQFENFDDNNDNQLDGAEAANAGPDDNPDNDANTNMVEWLTQFDPNDPSSFFSWSVTDRSGTTVSAIANKVVPGTSFRLQSSLDLENGPWATVDSLDPAIETFDQPFSDSNALEAERWYRFVVEKAP